MTTIQKERIDKLLFNKGFAQSREKAKALIMAGQIIVNDNRVDKAGTLVPVDANIRIRGEHMPFVSRGGLKLEHAVQHFNINVEDKVAIDVGASTGGFTDCLLQRNIKKVYSIDVGYGQMDLKVKNDPRVTSIERTNIREMPPEKLPEKSDLAVIDVSFISLSKVLPHILPLLKKEAEIVALIKPQFEVGKGEVGKGGIVRDPAKVDQVINDIICFIKELGLTTAGTVESPILGAKGNKEILVYIKKRNAV